MKFRIVNSCLLPADEYALKWVKQQEAKNPDFVQVWSMADNRTPDQNKKLWAMLKDFSDQIEWGGELRSTNEWKHLLSASFEKLVMLPALDGGIVAIPSETRKMTKSRFRDFIESIYATGNELGVKWSDPALEAYEQMIWGKEHDK